MKVWNELSMAEKADVMKLAIEGGVYDLDAIRSGYNEYAKGGKIHIDPSKKGTFTAAASKHGMGVQQFASKVLAHPENYSPAMRKKANFARNAAKWKHEDGGSLYAHGGELGNYYDGWGDALNFLKKGWNKVKDAVQASAVYENPAVMMAAGQKVNQQGKVEYNHINDNEVKQLRNNLATLGEGALSAVTATGDVEAAYNMLRHPVQTAKAIKASLKPVYNKIANKSKAKVLEEESFIPDYIKRKVGSNITEESVVKDINKAKDYKESDGYRKLVESFIAEAGDNSIPVDAFYRSRKSVPEIILEKRPDGHLGGYNYHDNRLSVDPAQATEDVPFHEGLHWQRIGKPEVERGEAYEAWAKAFDENAPEEIQDALFNKYYNSELGKQAMRQEKAIKDLYDRKVEDVLYSDVSKNSEMRKHEELLAHTWGVGESLGLEAFQDYPGMAKALDTIEKARKKDSFLWDVKAGTQDEVQNFWKLLTGNYAPSVMIGTSALGLEELKK